jgi:CRP/FNR family transcriptional regulator, cyclic AMP receptor protein
MSRRPKPRPVKPSANQKTAGTPAFDPAVFLATAAVGRDISKYSKKKVIFAQGDDADAVSISRRARSKSPSYPMKERKPLLHCWGRTSLSVKDA